MNPEISVVLPTYNGARFIQQSIESVLVQTFLNWELIIVDDCSTDNTFELVKVYADSDKRIKIISNKVNKKLPASLNIGFKQAKGRFLTWTSDDNYYAPNAFEKMLNVFKNNPSIDFVYADMCIVDSVGRLLKYKHRHNEICTLYHGCIGACFLYNRKLYESFGGYSEDMFCAEDYEYWMRLWVNKTRFYHIKEYLYAYRSNPASLSATKAFEVQEKTFKLKLMYWDKVPVGRFKKCLALYKPYRKTRNPFMLKQIYAHHPVLGRLVHLIKLKGIL